MNNMVVYIKSKFAPVGKYEIIKVPTGERKKALFG